MINIAIDGPSGAGKSTLAKAVAKTLKIHYLDTGAMYRGIAYAALQAGIDVKNEEQVKNFLNEVCMDTVYDNEEQKVLVNGENVMPFIRTPEVSKAASDISAHPCVRLKLVAMQREVALRYDVVLDGRDIGTFVLPDAKYKFFVTADVQERARRRHAELLQNGINILGSSLNTFLSIALSIPLWITIIFIVILSTYFFSRDMSSIKRRALSIFSESGKEKFEKVWNQGIKMLSQYAKAYFFIYFLTFLQTLIGFSILGVKYSVILSIICAIADILPVLGIGLIYLPLALIYLLSGNYFAAAGILILFVLISAVRQVVEPKIVSTSLGIHPVITLVAIFIGLKAFGLAGMIYFTFMVVFYKVLKNSKLI